MNMLFPSIAAPSVITRSRVTAGSTSALSDWIARSTAPDVEFASDFSGANDFVLASTNGGHVYAAGMDPTILGYVVKDLTDGITNGCCLRIDTPAAVGANSAAWEFPLSSSFTQNSDHFGVGVPFWIQFRFKIPSSRLVLSNCGGEQRGWKFMNIAQYSPTDTDSQSFSNTHAEHVLQDTNQDGFPQAYNVRDGGNSFVAFTGFEGGQITLQTAIDRGAGFSGGERYCHYPGGTAACEYFVTDEWMTFMVRIKPTTYTGTTGNEFTVKYARWGATEWTTLFHDTEYEIGSPNSQGGGFAGINGAHLLTYETNRINSTVDTHQKYDQIIVSLSEIALPAPGA